MGQNQPITLVAAAVMALLAGPVQAQTASPKPQPAPGTAVTPRQPPAPNGFPAVLAPAPVPAPPPAKPVARPIEGSGGAVPQARSARAGLAPKVLVEPLILWQPEGSISPGPAAAQGPSAASPGRPPGGNFRSAPGPSRPNGQVDPFAPMGPGSGINPLLPGMAPNGAGVVQNDPKRRGGLTSPGGGLPGARPQQRLGRGPNVMPMAPGSGSIGAPQGQMPEAMMPPPGAVPPGMVPPGALPPGMMPPGAMPSGAMPPGYGRTGPGALPPGVVPPEVQTPDTPATGSPKAGAKSSQEWSPWPSLLAALGLGATGALLAFVARRRSTSGSPTLVTIGEQGLKKAPLGRIKTGDRTD